MTKSEASIPEADEKALSALSALRDALGQATEEDASQIASWEKMIKSHSLRKAWLSNPITQEVFGALADKIVRINSRLSTEGEMEEATRRGIFSEKQAYTWLLSLFTDAKDDTVLESLAREIDSRTEAFISYNRLS